MEDVRAAAYAGSTEGDGAIGVDAGGVCVRARRRSRHHWRSAQALEGFFFLELLGRESGQRSAASEAWQPYLVLQVGIGSCRKGDHL